MRWSISGRTVATAATANQAGSQLWNASSTRTVWVTAIAYAKTVATADFVSLRRTTVRGTPTVSTGTISSTIASDWERELAPPSTAALDISFTGQPTFEGVPLFAYALPAAIASGFIMPFESKDIQGIKILPGAGLALLTVPATILQPADVSFSIYE